MTLEKLMLDAGLINDHTEIWIRDSEFQVLTHGNWYQDNVLDYAHCEIESFTWQNDNHIYIDLKKFINFKRFSVKERRLK